MSRSCTPCTSVECISALDGIVANLTVTNRETIGARTTPQTNDNTEITLYSLRKNRGNIIKIETELDDPDAGYAELWLKSPQASWSMYASEDNNQLRFYEYVPGPLVSQSTDRMVISSGGLVGIGTTEPQARLHVASDAPGPDAVDGNLRVDNLIIWPYMPRSGISTLTAGVSNHAFIPPLIVSPSVTASFIGTDPYFCTVSNISSSGFTINCFDLSGNPVPSGSVSWIAVLFP